MESLDNHPFRRNNNLQGRAQVQILCKTAVNNFHALLVLLENLIPCTGHVNLFFHCQYTTSTKHLVELCTKLYHFCTSVLSICNSVKSHDWSWAYPPSSICCTTLSSTRQSILFLCFSPQISCTWYNLYHSDALPWPADVQIKKTMLAVDNSEA